MRLGLKSSLASLEEKIEARLRWLKIILGRAGELKRGMGSRGRWMVSELS